MIAMEVWFTLSFDADGWKDERRESRRKDFHNCQMMSWVLAARDNGISLFWQAGIILRQAFSSKSIRDQIRTCRSATHWERLSLVSHNNTFEQMIIFTLTSSRSYILHAAAKSIIPEHYRHNRISISVYRLNTSRTMRWQSMIRNWCQPTHKSIYSTNIWTKEFIPKDCVSDRHIPECGNTKSYSRTLSTKTFLTTALSQEGSLQTLDCPWRTTAMEVPVMYSISRKRIISQLFRV